MDPQSAIRRRPAECLAHRSSCPAISTLEPALKTTNIEREQMIGNALDTRRELLRHGHQPGTCIS
jgi:hypothetical protein